MRASFDSFKEEFSGDVFIIFSIDGEIVNSDVNDEIKGEIESLSSL